MIVITAGCGPRPGDSDRMRIVATFYPLAFFAREIGKDLIAVDTLVPVGVEPHEWEPALRDMDGIAKARLFIYNGAGLEPWANRLIEGLGPRSPRTVEASQGIELIPGDPHVWLDPLGAKHIVERIRDALVEVDPANGDQYRSNAGELVQRLEALDTAYSTKLAGARGRQIVTSHRAFGYLARRYGLEQVAILGLIPDTEPRPDELVQIIQLIRHQKISYIFHETLVSPKLAQTIANETGAQTLVLNPVEGLTPEESTAGKDYFTLMQENLDNLSLALDVTP
ncbi:MAG: metal ABC transporter solute-binding protein, Zn/Mn family [Bacillota bacterium]